MEWNALPDNLFYEQLIKLPIKVLGYYDVLQNDDGELAFSIKDNLLGKPDRPTVYYDGLQHALLMRNDQQVIICDFLHPGIREAMIESPSVYIFEIAHEDVAEDYLARMVPTRGVEALAQQLMDYAERWGDTPPDDTDMAPPPPDLLEVRAQARDLYNKAVATALVGRADDFQDTFGLFMRAARLDYLPAAYATAFMLAYGLGTQANPAQAEEILQGMVERDSLAAQLLLIQLAKAQWPPPGFTDLMQRLDWVANHPSTKVGHLPDEAWDMQRIYFRHRSRPRHHLAGLGGQKPTMDMRPTNPAPTFTRTYGAISGSQPHNADKPK